MFFGVQTCLKLAGGLGIYYLLKATSRTNLTDSVVNPTG